MQVQETINSIEVTNVVTRTHLNKELDLGAVADALGAKYRPEQFHSLVYKPFPDDGDAPTILIFRSGITIAVGGTTAEDCNHAIDHLQTTLNKHSIPNDIEEPEIVNIVSKATLTDSLNLNAISLAFGMENVEYDPELLAGLIYRIDDPDVVFILFASGKSIITGATEHEEVRRGVTRIQDKLDDYGLL